MIRQGGLFRVAAYMTSTRQPFTFMSPSFVLPDTELPCRSLSFPTFARRPSRFIAFANNSDLLRVDVRVNWGESLRPTQSCSIIYPDHKRLRSRSVMSVYCRVLLQMEDPSLLEESSILIDPSEVVRGAPLRLGWERLCGSDPRDLDLLEISIPER